MATPAKKALDMARNKSMRRKGEKTDKKMHKEGYKGYYESLTGKKHSDIPF